MRSYSQYCPAALALDLVGDRWTLLIVRELGIRPARYGDLRDSLPGIATNLLAERLRTLTTAGVVAVVPVEPPTTGTVYDLTPWGRELYDIVVRLGRWAGHLLVAGQGDCTFQAHHLVGLVHGLYGLGDADLAGVEPLSVRVTDGDEVVRIDVAPTGVEARVDHHAAPADVTLDGDAETIIALLAGVAPLGRVERDAAGFRATASAARRFKAWTARSPFAVR